MSTSKYIDKICAVALTFVLLITFLFINAKSFGVMAVSAAVGYQSRLFDTSIVHTIDIVMDDWDTFLEGCLDEKYETCAVIIDDEAYRNVAIRAKGNTSLSSAAAYGNGRYSFKIEFDHYDSSNTYYGLDKLCLNNIIQDNTYMKDYLTYRLMHSFGANAPLCSYAYITVNGEDFGLYLAVEGVEDAFLQRNYGNDYGELYKPDSSTMGGGRGNGRDFDMEEFQNRNQEDGDTSQEFTFPVLDDFDGEIPQDFNFREPDNFDNEMPQNFNFQRPDDFDGEMPQDFNFQRPDDFDSEMPQNFNFREPNDLGRDFDANMPEMSGRGSMGRGGSMMGSSDVSLIYTDDEYDSYSNIFDNAKTDISNKDKDRLIASLKQLGELENIKDIVNIEKVIRYFVVHNFVLNFDSYTGSMIHNYYLYEKDGQLSMIPWDYNLAFGGFMSQSNAATLVNYPIDTPVFGGTVDSRPMLAWIFSNEEYTDLYHQYFEEFIAEYFDSGYFTDMITSIEEMIAPYVEKDPTKFCTYEEFEEGMATLKKFCLLRAQSISGQLNGSIPSTSNEQRQDDSSLIDVSNITISSMGSMGNMMGPGGDKREGMMGPNRINLNKN